MSGNDGAGPCNSGEEQAEDANNAVSYWRLSQQMSNEDNYVEQDGGGDHEHDGGDDEATIGVGEDDTTTDGGDRTDGGARTDGASSDPSAKKNKKDRKDRTPQVLLPICEEITGVSLSGLPLEPVDVARGYNMQLGCIVRESMSINTKHIRSNPALVNNIIRKLHKRYKFPAQYDNLDVGNAVNRLAVTKMSNALSSWKSRVKTKIGKGQSWETISLKEPMIDEEEFNTFKAGLASEEAKIWTAWGKKMRDMNIGNHKCGSGGYRGKQQFGTRRTPSPRNSLPTIRR